MLLLPRLKIERDEYKETWLVEKMRAWLKDQDKHRADGIHATDLLNPRKAYWNWAAPKELSEKQIGLFVAGKVLHAFILESADPVGYKGGADSGSKEAHGIVYSPDYYDEGVVTEVKTNRSQYEPYDYNLQHDLGFYIEQLIVYQVLEQSLIGYLWVFYINLKDESGKTYPTSRCFKVELTKAQFDDLQQQVFELRDLLQDAKERRDPSNLLPCRAWLCGTICEHWSQCRPPGRFPDTNKKRWTV